MPRGKSTVEYVLISDPTKLARARDIYQKKKLHRKNHHKALEFSVVEV